MRLEDVLIRLTLTLLISGIIGYEREVNNAHAGVKTHMIVGVGAAIIALLQTAIATDTMNLVLANPDLTGVIRTDPGRLIAQVISGIGFLGAGTIIVTKRNISGLTTAASIWTTASIGISLGMGYYEIAIAGFAFVFLILFVIKRIMRYNFSERLMVKYIGGPSTLNDIENVFESMGVKHQQIKYDMDIYGEERIYTSVFELSGTKQFQFSEFVSILSHMSTIISVQTTNLE